MFEKLIVTFSALCYSSTKITYFTFLCAVSSIQNASDKLVSCIYLYFVNFALHPTPQTKILRS